MQLLMKSYIDPVVCFRISYAVQVYLILKYFWHVILFFFVYSFFMVSSALRAVRAMDNKTLSHIIMLRNII